MIFIKTINSTINKFEQIKDKGWIKARNKNYNESGLLFEHLLIKENNNNPWADTNEIEIKTKIKKSNEITLLSLEPDSDFCEIESLKNRYNTKNKHFKFAIYGNKFIKYNGYDFKLFISYQERKVYICTFKNYKLYEKKVYWTFSHLKTRLIEKLSTLMVIDVEKKSDENHYYYKYTNYKIYQSLNFRNFLKLIDMGKIIIKFNIGVHNGIYKNGKSHNHGTAFIIKKELLNFLYDKK